MAAVYVAKSRSLQTWGADVGLTKHLYKVGVADTTAEAAVQTLNEIGHAGHSDWTLVRARPVEALDEADLHQHLARKETMIDPSYYPQIKGARGIVKVKIANVENSFMVQQALANLDWKRAKVTPAEVATYLIRCVAD